MTEARHDAWADAMFRPYLRGITRRSFHAVRLLGEAPDLPLDVPLIIVANHGTWWDGFFIYLLNTHVLHRKLYVMMLEEQLRRYRFFRRLGAFGIEQGHPRSVRATLSYSAEVLKDASNCLCLFPQGTMRRLHDRPLGFKRGLANVLSMHGGAACILPVAIACEFLGERRPEAFFLADRHFRMDGATFPGIEWLEGVQADQMDRLQSMIAAGERGRILAGRSGSGDSK
jgi:1-acyl-sn-glycerol-3-phosphate acyltransferase